MDLGRLDQQIEVLQTIGYTLNTEEKLRLKIASNVLLQANQNIDQVKFWGRIDGLTKSYYIMLGLTYVKSYEFPHKHFFYSLSGDLDFKELPDLLVQHEGHSEKFNAMPFIGDIAKVLVNVEGEGQGQGQEEAQPPAEEGQPVAKAPVEEEDEELKKVPKKNFTQLNRLSYVVRAIEHDSHCVPRDSYKMTPEHELRPNTHFEGLLALNAALAGSWQHFRSPLTPTARHAMDSDNVVFRSDFLDGIETDKPMGSWSVQIDSKGKNVTVRSLKWPGYFAFNRLGSNLFGSVYIGEGSKNADLSFMI